MSQANGCGGEGMHVWCLRKGGPDRGTVDTSSETLTHLTVAQDTEFHLS